jgi:hypothetical protein
LETDFDVLQWMFLALKSVAKTAFLSNRAVPGLKASALSAKARKLALSPLFSDT